MIDRPYRRIIRPTGRCSDDAYAPADLMPNSYLMDPEYAPDRIELIRAYSIIERDLVRLFEHIEPANANLKTYSHRLYELLLRASTEFEANCKGVLEANGYNCSKDLSIRDYYKTNAASRLSEYEVRVSVWRGTPRVFRPLGDWSTGQSLTWYQEYNSVKHDRSRCFEAANLENVLSAVAGVLAVLFSQFHTLCFRAHAHVGLYHVDDGWFSHEDSIFAVKAPTTWTADEFYGFDWSTLRKQVDRFAKYPFPPNAGNCGGRRRK